MGESIVQFIAQSTVQRERPIHINYLSKYKCVEEIMVLSPVKHTCLIHNMSIYEIIFSCVIGNSVSEISKLRIPVTQCPSLQVKGKKINTVLEVRSHQSWVGRDNHFPNPAGHTISDASQDDIGLLGHLCTLLVLVQLAAILHPQVLFCWSSFQTLFTKPVVLYGVVMTQMQDLALSLVECHATSPVNSEAICGHCFQRKHPHGRGRWN